MIIIIIIHFIYSALFIRSEQRLEPQKQTYNLLTVFYSPVCCGSTGQVVYSRDKREEPHPLEHDWSKSDKKQKSDMPS